jgi:hypothetical protein
MKSHLRFGFVATLAGLAFGYATSAQALVTNTILSHNFDSDTVGALPSGWSFSTGSNSGVYVTNNVSSSGPNSFRVPITDSTFYTVQTPFTAHNLANGDPDNRLSYSIDINVDFIDLNDSEGIRLRIWNGTSQIDVGTPRILRNGTQWRFYNGLYTVNGGSAYIGNFNFDEWHNLRIVINPTTTTSGTADWYVDGVLLNTETYTGRSPVTQTSNLDVFDIFPVLDASDATDATVYFDNLLIQAILPEPSSVALLAVGGLMLVRRNQQK